MEKVEVVEVFIGAYLGTFAMLGYLYLWDLLFGLRINEVGVLFGLFMGCVSAICGVVTGMSLAYLLRRFA